MTLVKGAGRLMRKGFWPVRVLRQKAVFHKANRAGVNLGKRKIVVFESDDWGSIRVPSRQAYECLNRQGAALDMEAFTANDGLESAQDVRALLGVLKRQQDIKGRHPVLTMFYAMRNADFDRILREGYESFYDEPFTTTSVRYDGDDQMLQEVLQGVREQLFCPQLHCQVHLNVRAWLRDLKAGREDTRLAFQHGMVGVGTNFDKNNRYGYMDALHNRSEEEIQAYKGCLEEAVYDFAKVFGYAPTAFVAPCYVWDPAVEPYLFQIGIRMICGANDQLIPRKENYERFDRAVHPVGSINGHGMLYLNRNVDYELIYENPELDQIAMRQIAAAFAQGKPAVISIHRANFVSRISGKREERLERFSGFICRMLQRWPDIEFMSSVELGGTITRENERVG